MDETDNPFEGQKPGEPTEEVPMSREVAEDVEIRSVVAGGLKGRLEAAREGIEPPEKPSLKDRIEASRVLHEDNPQEEDSEDSE